MNAELLSLDDAGLMNHYNNSNKSFKDIFFPNEMHVYYRPIVISSFLIDYYIWMDHESGFHLTNMILHSANAILVYILFLWLVRDSTLNHLNGGKNVITWSKARNVAAFFAALLFAVHPINTEAVNFISGRTDILATFFVLTSFLLCLVRHSTLNKLESYIVYLASCLFYLLAILSKEVALAFPFIALAYELFFHQNSSLIQRIKSGLSLLIIFAIPVLIYFYMRSHGLSGGDIGIGKTFSTLYISKSIFFDGIASIGFYLKKLIYPFPLNLAIIHIQKGLSFVIGAVFLVSLFTMGLLTLNKGKGRLTMTDGGFVAFLLWAILFALLPSITISVTPIAWTPYAERYLYLPSTFFCILFGIFTMKISQVAVANFSVPDKPTQSFLVFRTGSESCGCKKPIKTLTLNLPSTQEIISESCGYKKTINTLTTLFILTIIIVFSTATYKRNILWLNNLTLWEDTIKKSPNFGKIYNEYGSALMRNGKEEKAKEQFLKGMEFGYKSLPLFNLGLIAMKNNDLNLAEKYFNEGMRITPNAWAYRKLATIYLAKAERDNDKNYLLKGIESYERGYSLDRSNELLALKLGGLYYRVGKYEDAQAILQKAIKNNPNSYIEKPARKLLDKINKKLS
jgi:Flp pilus assembly protein TadD